jgi:nucleoside-diphosphate-sugar epimerase
MVDLEDVAKAAAVVLTEPGHAGATYELAGERAMTQIEVAEVLSQQLGRPVRAEVVPLDAWEQQARAAGLGDYQVVTLLKMFRYYEQYGFWGNPRVLGWLLGRAPTTFAAFVERIVGE